MRLPLTPVMILLIIGILVDWYIFRRLRNASAPKWLQWAHIALAAAGVIVLADIAFIPKKSGGDAMLRGIMWMLFGYMSVYLPKILFTLVDLVRLLLSRLFNRRFRGVSVAAAIFSVFVFAAMWWGAVVNRYRIDIKEVTVEVAGLPESFDGMTIAQISDIHTGSFDDDTGFFADLVAAVNSLNADIIVFTGDIVNRHSCELKPFMETLSELKAPSGVYSVMGNHDYGDYYRWPDGKSKAADVAALQEMETAMGWCLLNNSHRWLYRGNDSIVIIGVENIGDPPFHIYGDLGKAYPDISDGQVKILLSHNPAHWNGDIKDNPDANIALTLSGHTHAMQMSVAGHSPASFRYPTWGGSYVDSKGQTLYVNIGCGEVGFPARIGATPEVTFITLKRK